MALSCDLSTAVVVNSSVTPPLLSLVDTTGEYDAINRDTGYGGPNLSRSDVAVFYFAFKVNEDTSLTPVPLAPYNVLTAMAAYAEVEEDGDYTATIAPVTKTPPGGSSLAGYAWYDTVAQKVFKTVTNGTAAGATVLIDNTDPTPKTQAQMNAFLARLNFAWGSADYAVVIPPPPDPPAALEPVQLVIKKTALVTDEQTGKVIGFRMSNQTGNYNVSTNPKGFGTPNVARADTWIYYFADRLFPADPTDPASNNRVEALSLQEGYVGSSDESVTILAGEDMVVRVHAIPLTTIVPTGSFPPGTQWWDLSTSRYMQAVTSNQTSDAEEITTLEEAYTGIVEGDAEVFVKMISNANAYVYAQGKGGFIGHQCNQESVEKYFDALFKLFAVKCAADPYEAAEILNAFTQSTCGC